MILQQHGNIPVPSSSDVITVDKPIMLEDQPRTDNKDLVVDLVGPESDIPVPRKPAVQTDQPRTDSKDLVVDLIGPESDIPVPRKPAVQTTVKKNVAGQDRVKTSSKGTQADRKPPCTRKMKGTQTLQRHHAASKSVGTQYCREDIGLVTSPVRSSAAEPKVFTSTPRSKKVPSVDADLNKSFISTSSWAFQDDSRDRDYSPDVSFMSETDEEDTQTKQSSHKDQKKYLVFEDNLLSLFETCELCRLPTDATVCQQQGSYIAIRQSCHCGHIRRWESQPKVRGVPVGNMLLSAGIMFSGCAPSKVLRIFSFISLQTFFVHQRTVLWPAIQQVWDRRNSAILRVLRSREDELIVAGDGRSDSPGHSAKYGSYTLIDMFTGKVIALELVQSNEVKSSYHMELEGLKRVTDFLHRNGLTMKEIVTDRHVQIQKWIRESLPGTTHAFDVWHVAKGTKAAVKLEDMLLSTRLVKDFHKLSTGFQTSTLEAFHSSVNQFAPKMNNYSYHGQMCRQYLAALHFNENVHRGTKKSADGSDQIKVLFPKYDW